jgi:XTP/dITP diphosphohydrolase
MTKLVVATGNPGKLGEMQAYLVDSGWDLILKPEELDIEETGTTFAANARLKASQVALATGNWAIADDSGLAVDALDGAPGVYSARYGANDAERISRLLKELGDHKNRQAKFICAVAMARPDGAMPTAGAAIALESEGVCLGEILHAPRGEGGFGYDPIFYVPQTQLTYAEMPKDVKRSISHRGKAFSDLLQKLKTLKQ